MIDIAEHDLQTVKRILSARVPEFEARAFGSRYRWTAKEYSDLDLAIVGERPPTLSEMANLRADFEDSDLPFRVDVLDWQTISPEFRRVIESGYEVIQRPRQDNGQNIIWKTVNLEDALDALIDYRGKTPTKTSTGIPLITAKIIKDGFVQEPEEFIAETDYDAWMTRGLPQVDDVVLTTEAPLGEVAQLNDSHVALAQRVVTLRGKKGVLENSYLKYFLQSEIGQSRLREKESGTTVTGIKQSELRLVKIDLPPLQVQQGIGNILSTLDDKIELNRRMNETLESIARALFKSWFVNFDPVRARAVGEQPAGMDAETAALFPDAFEDSELGEIPRGWRVRTLEEVIEVTKGRSYTSAELQPSNIALVTLKSFNRGGGYRNDGLKSFTGKYKPEQVIQPGELIISFTDVTQQAEVIGKPALVKSDSNFATLVASLDVGIVRPTSSEVSVPFLYMLLLQDAFQSHIYGFTTGTTVLHLDRRGISKFRFTCPTKDIASKFKALTSPLFSKIESNQSENSSLVALREALLPKLISGEVRATTS